MTTLDNIRANIINEHRSSGVIVAREIQRLGLGKFVTGRRGDPSRLEWHFCPTSVGKVARGEMDAFATLSSEDEPCHKGVADEPGDDGTTDEAGASVEYATHDFRLRPGEQVRFQLPGDLTRLEAGRLCDFIKSLPLE